MVMYDLHNFGLREMIESGRELRKLGGKARSMDEAAGEIVSLFYDRFADTASTPNCVLVRCFKTHAFSGLPKSLQQVMTTQAALAEIAPETQCLCLLASRGEQPEWNTRAGSLGHQAIPLLSPETIRAAPMIARLFGQMGVGLKDVLEGRYGGDSLMVDEEGIHFNVFHVEEALGSEFVPAQEGFVKPYGVRSVVGFGGVLPSHELFAFVLFSRVPISRETAELFRTLALGAKLVLLPYAGRQVFD